MTLPLRTHTVGNRRRFIVDYKQWMNRGTTVVAFAVAISAGAVATIDDVSITGDGRGMFFVEGGLLDEQFTVTLTMTTSYGEIKIDDIPFLVIAR